MQDIDFIARHGGKPVAWRWYQEGYDHEPTDMGTNASHNSYISHHEAPQYFGYIANNPTLRSNIRGLGDFFTDMAEGKLPADGGVFYIRGGYQHLNPNALCLRGNARREGPGDLGKWGDDDHPGYSDHQISEAMNARVINAVAKDPEIWKQSIIIIAYDESDGFYDHVPPRILSYGPDGLPLSRGIRVPLIVISPYARVHAVSHAEGDHNAVIQTINAIFGRPALASLPDEAAGARRGQEPGVQWSQWLRAELSWAPRHQFHHHG